MTTLVRRGKVREMYAVGDDRLLMVASDRVSAFDVIMDQPIPGKGAVLTALSAFWFRYTRDVVPNHFLSDDPLDVAIDVTPFADQWLLVRRAERIDIECVVRGYLAGSAWAEYRSHGTVAGERLPAGLVESERLDQPRFTPAIKAETGHDENISRDQLTSLMGESVAAQLEKLSLELYRVGAEHALRRGLILADTKFEFGYVNGQITLIDELMTPDSSRYWPTDGYAQGRPQASFDKQFLRDYLVSSGWNREPPPPPLPESVIQGTADRYQEALRRLSTLSHVGGTLTPTAP